MHGGTNPGAREGNQHALRSGFYTAKSLGEDKEARALLLQVRRLKQALAHATRAYKGE